MKSTRDIPAASTRVKARAFTIVELLIGIVIISVLAALLIVSVRSALRTTRGSADAQTLSTIKLAVDKFKQDFGFLPPLIHDDGDSRQGAVNPIQTNGRPVIFETANDQDRKFLHTKPAAGQPDLRYSVRSLPFYILGALDAKSDGVDGIGFRPPTADGNFRLSDRSVNQPMLDLGKSSLSLFAATDAKTTGRYELRDRKGNPVRYYRWLTGREQPAGSNNYVIENTDDLNVPEILGDVEKSPRLRDAEYGLVMAGEDGLFGDEALSEILTKLGLPGNTGEALARSKAREDNVVEVGK